MPAVIQSRRSRGAKIKAASAPSPITRIAVIGRPRHVHQGRHRDGAGAGGKHQAMAGSGNQRDPFPQNGDGGGAPKQRERPAAEIGCGNRQRRQHRGGDDALHQIVRRRRLPGVRRAGNGFGFVHGVRIRSWQPGHRTGARAAGIRGSRLPTRRDRSRANRSAGTPIRYRPTARAGNSTAAVRRWCG